MIIDGRKIAVDIIAQLKTEVAALPFRPVFCDVLVGEDPASVQYVRIKGQWAKNIGLAFRAANFPAEITTEQLEKEILRLNRLPDLRGLIVQLPLPPAIRQQQILDAVDPRVDVDCLGRVNAGSFYSGRGQLAFPTAAAIMRLLESLDIDLKSQKFLVVGQGMLVGRPVTYLLKRKGYAVNVATQLAGNLKAAIGAADIVIAAAGRPKLITGGMLKPGCAVIDAGTSELAGGIVGDVDFESAQNVAAYLSPVPGGVGPVTVAELLSNVVKVAKNYA